MNLQVRKPSFCDMSTESVEDTPVTALISGMELLAVNGHSFDNLPITINDPLWEVMRIEYKTLWDP
jgi:hypothetical protein